MIFVELPPKKSRTANDIEANLFELHKLFETEDESDEFLGFELGIDVNERTQHESEDPKDSNMANKSKSQCNLFHELQEMFLESSKEEEDFLGFDNGSNSDLNSLFCDDSNVEEFFGF